MEAEGNVLFHALAAQVQNPVIVAGPGLHAGLLSRGHLLDPVIQIGAQIQPLQQGRGDDGAVFDGQVQEDGQAVVRPILIFHRTADEHIVIALAPVRRQAVRQPVDAFGEEIEPAVAALAHHPPALRPPGVRVLQKEIRGEAGEYNLPRRNFVAPVPPPLHWQRKGSRFSAQAAGQGAAIHFVLPVDVAVFAARADLGAAVPGVPVSVDVQALSFSHKPAPFSLCFLFVDYTLCP